MLEVVSFTLGPAQTNAYLVADSDTKEAVVIDPAWDGHVILEAAKRHGWRIGHLWYTHAHFDHIGGAGAIADALNPLPLVALHPNDHVLWRAGGGGAFFGFDIDKEEVDEWCFVLEEQMTEPRFGFDVDVPVPGQPQGSKPLQRAALKSALVTLAQPGNALTARGYNPYKALSWSHLQVQAGSNFRIGAVRNLSAPPFADFPSMPGDTSAEIAKLLIQQPFRAYYLGDDLAT